MLPLDSVNILVLNNKSMFLVINEYKLLYVTKKLDINEHFIRLNIIVLIIK